MQYANDCYAKSCSVAGDCDESISGKIFVFVEGVNPSICLIFRKYWATHPQRDVTDIALQSQSLWPVQEVATKLASTENQDASSEQYMRLTWNNPSPHAI